MEEFIVDEEYKMVKNNSSRNIWNVYKNNTLINRPKKYYKYYSLTSLNLDALYRNYFYLANPKSFNDPFDCNINLLKLKETIKKNNSIKRNDLKSIGICSLSSSVDNHLMWAHYTNNYNGFVVEFKEVDVIIKKDDYKMYALCPVLYSLTPPRVNTQQSYAHQYFLSTKLKHWEYENEWRTIVHLNTDNREMKFCPNVVTAIYVGHNVKENNLGLFKMICEIQKNKYPEASIYLVSPHLHELKLNFIKFKS